MEENETNIPTIDTVEQPYDPASLENIKRVLDMSLKAGRPQSFEIEVDGLRVVQRTPVLEMFDTYKPFIHPATRKIIVTVYRGVRTPACTKHVFSRDNEKPLTENLGNVQQQSATPPGFLSGTEVKQMMQDMLDKERMNNRIVTLEEKLEDRDKKVKEAEDYIMRLQGGIEKLKQEVESKGSQLLDKFFDIAKNPPDWIKLMILQNSKGEQKGLSGTDKEESSEQEVTIRKKQPQLSQEEKEFIGLMKRMEENLDEDEFGLLMMVNDKLIEESELIEKVADLIDVKLPEEE